MDVLVTFGRSRTRPFSLPPIGRVPPRRSRKFMRRYRAGPRVQPVERAEPRQAPGQLQPAADRDVLPHAALGVPGVQACSAPTSSTTRASSAGCALYLQEFARGHAPQLLGAAQLRRRQLGLGLGHAHDAARSARASSGSPRPARSSTARKPTKTVPGDRRLLIRTGPQRAVAATKRVFALAAPEPADRARLHLPLARGRAARAGTRRSSRKGGTLRPSFDVFASQARIAQRRAAGQGS